MYVVDITRTDKNSFETDMLVGKFSMDAKLKTINYICDYALVNYNINIEKEDLDYYLNLDFFSLKQFLINHSGIEINNDLIIQSLKTDKDNCLFVKKYSLLDDDFPIIYVFNNNDIKKANQVKKFLINDFLISEQSNVDLINYFDKLNSDYKNSSLYCDIYYPEKQNIFSSCKNNMTF